ncbi:MAG: hypothetical protein ACP5TL_00890 [Candidatus Micrarchaeia archaeon]
METKSRKKTKLSINEIAEKLWQDPSEENWKAFYDVLNNSKARYYKIIYEKKLGKSEDLTKSFARVYDAGLRPIAKIPIIKKSKNKIEGATIYLRNLHNANIFE